MSLLTRLALSALTLLVVAAVVPGIHADGFGSVLLAAVALALVNAFVRPILVVLTLPLTIITLGLFLLVINGGMLLLVGHVIAGFTVRGWGAALVGSLLLWLAGMLINRFVQDEDEVHWDWRLIRR